MRILLVDDDRDLVAILTFALRRVGFTVLPAFDPEAALGLVKDAKPHLAVIDVNLGVWNGFDLLKDLRRRSSVPVIILTARGAEEDKLLGFELGADDYVTKPFSHRELTARIRAVLKRRGEEWSPPEPGSALLCVGPIQMNVAEHTVTKEGQPLTLTVTEFRLLHYLLVNAGVVVPVTAILKHVWGYEDSVGSDVVRVTVHRLRRKLEDGPNKPRLLHTVPGAGIMLKVEAG